jgi:hypothetical protein
VKNGRTVADGFSFVDDLRRLKKIAVDNVVKESHKDAPTVNG